MQIRSEKKHSRFTFVKDAFVSIDVLDITDTFPLDVVRVVCFKADAPLALFKEIRQLALKAQSGEKLGLDRFVGSLRADKLTNKKMAKIEGYMPSKKAI